MTALLAPADALSRVPGFGTMPLEWHALEGGLTNRSYVVKAGSADFVLRLDAAHTAAFCLDRDLELEVLRHAGRARLAPAVHYADPAAGILVVEYLPGQVWGRQELEDERNLGCLARLLRAVHELPKSNVALDIAAAVERYHGMAAADPTLQPPARRWLQVARQTLSLRPAGEVLVCCHNDVVSANIIGGDRLKLLDWEYACDNVPYFDLASVIAWHGLGRRHARTLLSAYAGGLEPEAWERLQVELRLFDALQWLWLAARETLAPDPANRVRLNELQQRNE